MPIKDDKKNFKTARTIFNRLKTDLSSVVFAEELLDKKLMLKLKKLNYVEDKKFFELVYLNNTNVIFESENVKRTDYVEKREIDHSTLYSFDAPFRLFHADVGNLQIKSKKKNRNVNCQYEHFTK